MRETVTSKAYNAWLGYDQLGKKQLNDAVMKWMERIVVADKTPVILSAVRELEWAAKALRGTEPQVNDELDSKPAIVLGTLESLAELGFQLAEDETAELTAEGYFLKTMSEANRSQLIIGGREDRGVLYGVFHFLRLLQTGQAISDFNVCDNPRNPLRIINQWDNMDGSIERGYAGRSIFYDQGQITSDVRRIEDYARLLASVSVNAIAINNVNVHERETKLITAADLPDVARLAAIFRKYGIRLFLSINFASPIQLGGLSTADPLDPEVQSWWKAIAKQIYAHIPDFGGFLVKADSEHRPGPFTYGRDHADGANMLAEALEPYGGLVIWRCFVYNCMQDWRDRSTDRARAAYDHFKPLDGRFHRHVILQVKNGPMDFQVREPVSPLLGALEQTNEILELQITQEYTGQQRHLCYLVPQWKEVLQFDTFARGKGSTIDQIASGSLFQRPHGGIAGVSNIGNDDNWTGHLLAQANLYGFGRLAWNPELSSEQITDEWVRMTFGGDPDTTAVVSRLLLQSWRTYEDYTSPLGVGWMVNPDHHYGPNVDGYEYSRWGTYHFADRDGIGVDRTVKTGTGYTAQYHGPNAALYESLETCPDELLLFFHHVPYTHKLHSGKTVIQHIYDTHFEGVEKAEQMVSDWTRLKGIIDDERYTQVLQRLHHQAEHAREWRDIINTYFYRKSGIPDQQGRTIF